MLGVEFVFLNLVWLIVLYVVCLVVFDLILLEFEFDSGFCCETSGVCCWGVFGF